MKKLLSIITIKKDNISTQEIQNKALAEFDKMVEKLKKVGVNVKSFTRYKGAIYTR